MKFQNCILLNFGRTHGRTYLQDGRFEVPNGPWPLQIYGVNLKPIFTPYFTR